MPKKKSYSQKTSSFFSLYPFSINNNEKNTFYLFFIKNNHLTKDSLYGFRPTFELERMSVVNGELQHKSLNEKRMFTKPHTESP